MGIAYGWANTDLQRKSKETLFCVPGMLTVEHEVDIMVRHIEQVPEDGKQPAGIVMLYALKEAFPCKP